jgi:hypothetical protein
VGAFSVSLFGFELGEQAFGGLLEVVLVGVLFADKFKLGAELRVIEAPAADLCA